MSTATPTGAGMAARLLLATALIAPSSASEQHECTLDAASCIVSCAACDTCTALSCVDMHAPGPPYRTGCATSLREAQGSLPRSPTKYVAVRSAPAARRRGAGAKCPHGSAPARLLCLLRAPAHWAPSHCLRCSSQPPPTAAHFTAVDHSGAVLHIRPRCVRDSGHRGKPHRAQTLDKQRTPDSSATHKFEPCLGQWLEVEGATITPAVGNGTSGTAPAQFYYAVCPSVTTGQWNPKPKPKPKPKPDPNSNLTLTLTLTKVTTGQWLDPEQIRCGPAPPPPSPHQPHDDGMHPPAPPAAEDQGASRWVGVVAEVPASSSACKSSPCSLAPSECAHLGRAEERCALLAFARTRCTPNPLHSQPVAL